MKHHPHLCVITITTLLGAVLAASGCSSTAPAETRSVSISENGNGDGVVVAVSEALARSIVEGIVGDELHCGADLDSDFAAMLETLDRGGRGSRATLRDDDGELSARRSGRALKMRFSEVDGGGRLDITMPWAVAECLLDGSASLSAADAGSIRVRVVGADGGSFELKVD